MNPNPPVPKEVPKEFAPNPSPYVSGRMLMRAWRKKITAWLPWIKRASNQRQLQHIRGRNQNLVNALLSGTTFATQTPLVELAPIQQMPCQELCLFVSFAQQVTLKTHVIDHIDSLLNAGIKVILIINTDLPATTLVIPDALRARLNGCIVRTNIGYDFAAWAQACTLLDTSLISQRLYFVNDSIVGPLNPEAFSTMLTRLRKLSGDMTGLTESLESQPHIQSFFLSFAPRLFRSALFDQFTRGALNLPDKLQVIDLYETQLTRFVSDHGYETRALFSRLPGPAACSDETIQNWAGLIERGFPYIKASVLKHKLDAPEIVKLVPEKYRKRTS